MVRGQVVKVQIEKPSLQVLTQADIDRMGNPGGAKPEKGGSK